MTVCLGFLAFSVGGSGIALGYHRLERSMSDRLLARITHEGSSRKHADAKRDGHSEA